MNRFRLYLALSFVACCLTETSQAIDLTTYYAPANNKKAAELKTALKSVISDHTKLAYGSLWTYYEQIDYIEKGDAKQVFDYYSDIVAYFPEPSTMNKEHTVPQSWWGGGTGVAQGSDLFQVLPSEKNANSAKGSYPLGIVTGSVTYPSKGVSNTRMKTGKDKNNKMVFEPCDEYKGDFARIYMYVATCYSDVNWQRQNDLGCVFQKQEYPTFISQDFIKMLLQWCREDPVSDWERTRNERVYAVQQNRNPFVDYPSLFEYVWGDSIDYVFDITLPHGQGTNQDPDIPVDPVDPIDPIDPVEPVDSGTLEPEVPAFSVVEYRQVQGLNQAALKTALHDLIQPRKVLSYGGKGEGYTWSGFAVTDVMPDGSVRDRYSNIHREFEGLNAVTGMNIEHIWANSWWGHTVNNAYCDLFNLYPADGYANGRKSNNPIGVVDGATSFDNGVTKVGKSSSYDADQLITTWEPADEWKGDFARTYFYMATTYQHMADEWTTTEGLLTVDPEAWTTMRPWVYELMLSWAAADPVDDIERDRNEAIYGIQGNRNPYVDYPELADYVWGERNDEAFYIDPASTSPELFVPVQDATIDFGLQALSLGLNRRIMVRGRNLPTGLTATIEGEGFAMPDADLSAQEITAGTPLTITSTATAGGVYEATLILRSEDFYEQRTPLRMTMIDGVPAYPARNVTSSVNSTSFMATWMDMHLPEGEKYILDVYTKTSDGERVSFGTYPVELTDTFCFVRNPKASTTYYYEVRTTQGLVSNEVRVDMPSITPVFNASASELLFTSIPGKPSQPQNMKLTVLGISGYNIVVSCPEPFEVSLDGEEWTHDLFLNASHLEFQVRFGGVPNEGLYESEMTLLLPNVKELVVSLSAFVDVSKAFFESFEVGSKGSYAEASATCNAATWLMNNALISSTEAFRNDGRSVRMKIGGFITMQEDKIGGCDSLWFYAGLYNNDTGVKLTVSYSLDSGDTWTPIVSDLTFNAGEWKRYGYEVKRDGFIRLKFETQAGNQNKRINLDDIQMSDFGTGDALRDIEWTFDSDDVAVYTLDGRYLGTSLPAIRGIYIIRQGDKMKKIMK